ncbi:hypothetical protein [Sediminibacterium ginsengisoli]|uniref:Uncharacterized protein n=1 Tax=Sediminibacterium ginsengisoli TaxID=413434 RepID=A0A1T4KCV5_9BACT|nr:hypothetical protein [Sediminibacterium ginsengisoli]SJZ40197.1 hypothetical protein SAMN04488132_101619 [Sediminibacterium ginsengisoli]
MKGGSNFGGWCGLLIFILCAGGVQAQQARYIYIQSENNQPYYVYLNGKNYSSGSTGYLLIPQLTAGKYTITLGFPKRPTEYNFSFALAEEDRGFTLKPGLDNSWTLFDLVSFDMIRGTMAAEKDNRAVAAQTPPPAEKTEKKPEEPATIAAPVVKEPKKLPEARSGTTVKKIYEKGGTEGVDMVFEVNNGNRKDTVILFVPVLKDEKTAAITNLSPARNTGSVQDLPALSIAMLAEERKNYPVK